MNFERGQTISRLQSLKKALLKKALTSVSLTSKVYSFTAKNKEKKQNPNSQATEKPLSKEPCIQWTGNVGPKSATDLTL